MRTVPRFGYAFTDAPAITVEPGAGALPGAIPQCRLTWSVGRAALCDGDHIVGRDADAELCLDSTSVSRRHALIRVSGSQATLEDLGSKNGTFVGNRRIDAPTPLADGDAITVGAFTLTFEAIHAHRITETW